MAEHLPFDIGLITVPTPVDELKHPDLTYIKDAASFIARHMRGGELVVLESTTYPGTTEDVVVEVIESVNGMKPELDYEIGYSPERINPGDKVNTFQRIPKIVSGLGENALARVQEFYATLVDRVVPVPSPRRPSWSRSSRTPSRRSTSHWSTRWQWSAPSWVSTWTRCWTPPRPRATPSCGSVRGLASVGTASPSTRCT